MTREELLELFVVEVVTPFVKTIEDQCDEEAKTAAPGSDAATMVEICREFARHVRAFKGAACCGGGGCAVAREATEAAAGEPCDECGAPRGGEGGP